MLQYFPNITGSLQVTGSVLVSGSITATAGITISGSIDSASYAANADKLDNLDSTAFVFTSSYNPDSSSLSSRVTKIEGNYATTGSNVFLGAQTVCANITSTGTIIAQTLNVQQVTSSIVYSSGSNIFGCSTSDVQQMTGSVRITGSLNVTGVSCFSSTICAVNLSLSGDINSSNPSVFDINSAPSVASVMRLQRSGGTGGIEIYQGNTTTRNIFISNTGELCLSNTICSPKGVFSCCLGIGVINPAKVLDVVCTGTTTNCLVDVIKISHITCATAASGLGAGILFTSQRPSSNLNINRAGIYGISGTDADDDGDMAFYTLSNTGATGFNQKMRITSDGYVAVTGNQANVCVPYLQGMSLGWNRSNGQGEAMINWTDQGGGTNPALTFNYRNSTTLCERMRIDCSGNVGIGTSSPDRQLEVMSTTGATLRLKRDDTTLENNDSIGTIEFFTNDGDGPHVASYIKGLGADLFGNFGRYGALSFGVSVTANTDAVEIMRITECGNVGIGTCLPSTILHLATTTESNIRIESGGPGGDQGAIYVQKSTGGGLTFAIENRDFIWRTGLAGLTGGGGSERMRITSTGIACFACQVCAPTLIVQRNLGTLYNQTSTTGTTSIVDTGIFYNTAVVGFGGAAIYQLILTGNANAAGSGAYQNMIIGYVTIVTGFDFGISNVINQIAYSDILNRSASNVGGLTITACFWNGSAESSQQVAGTTTNQIRIKVTGYNSSFVGSNQELRLTKLI